MNNSKYKAIIFDLDGTLINTIRDIAESSNHALIKLGRKAEDSDVYLSRVGWGLRTVMEKSLPGESSDLIDKATELLKEHYNANPCVYTAAYPGIKNTVTHCKQSGLQLFVYTNKAEDIARVVVEKIFGKGTFKDIFGAVDHRPLKPEKEGIKAVIASTGFKTEEIVYIGDSEVDMETASAGKLEAIAVGWGFRTEEQLKDYPKLAFIKDPSDIASILLGDSVEEPVGSLK